MNDGSDKTAKEGPNDKPPKIPFKSETVKATFVVTYEVADPRAYGGIQEHWDEMVTRFQEMGGTVTKSYEHLK